MISREDVPQRGLILQPVRGHVKVREADLALEEAVGLAQALDVEIAHALCAPLREVQSANFFGSGKVEEIAAMIKQYGADLVVINADLAPIQQRNLERTWKVKVIDRTGMILEIFALRAATAEGALQVELARLGYERSRLVRTWTHLERQRGGQGTVAGPGETQIESDRRQLDDKMRKLRRDLAQVRRTRALQRTKRQRAPERVVALVGYTNTGKSTLFNRLTEGGVLAKDMLFATLDTTHRVLPLPSGQKAVMSDTVGFIANLPTDLIDAFRATLEEIKEADLLVHVRDISDPLSEERKKNVHDVLESIGAGPGQDQPIIEVWNKIDKLDEDAMIDMKEALARSQNSESIQAFAASSLKGTGVETLLEGIEAALSAEDEVLNMQIAPKDFKVRAWVYENGDVLDDNLDPQGIFHIKARLTQINAGIVKSRYPQVLG